MTLASKQKLSNIASHFHSPRSAEQMKWNQSCRVSWGVYWWFLPEVSEDARHCHTLSREQISLYSVLLKNAWLAWLFYIQYITAKASISHVLISQFSSKCFVCMTVLPKHNTYDIIDGSNNIKYMISHSIIALDFKAYAF